MAASRINERLDYLISYSSQLVFVCSDKIKQQSQVIESFLSEKNEQAELAILTANELWPLATYREKLFRQLVSQSKTADFNRPLNQLLSSLNNHQGPILVSIFQAERLPNQLVKEVWELVLQSRFANNSQQLNVLLMGQSNWAEKMKVALGAKSKDKPILLNQHQESPLGFDSSSDLDTLIQVKRQQFATRVANRQHASYMPEPIRKKWWVVGGLSLIFLAIFSSILGFLYPEKVTQWISQFELSEAEPPTVAIQETELVNPVKLPELKTTDVQISEAPITKANNSDLENPTTKDKLVTNWQTASANLDKQSTKIRSQLNTEPTQQIPSENEVVAVQEIDTKPEFVQDYQVEDITTYDQADSQPVQAIEAKPIEVSAQTQTTDFLGSIPTEHFVIQLAAMSDLQVLKDYMQSQGLSEQLWIYQTQRYGGNWYVLLNNEHFTSIEQARSKITELPPEMRENTPFVKSIRQINQEISLSSL